MFLFDPRWGNFYHGDGWIGAIPFEDERVTYAPSNRQQLDPESCEWMQFTGLLDKNGKEIYEGDLIKDSDSNYIGEVIFDEDSLCFTTKFQDNDLWGFIPRHGKDNHCEVIGNIYANLLEV